MELKPATRTNVKPLIGLYSESGCGKTYSALLLARGFVGPSGRIAMVDTESGRGSLYADVIPGGYEVVDISEPFSPSRAIEAIQVIERSGASIGIMDSASHFWEGLGGVLDMAMEAETKNGKSLNNWRAPKMEHAKFMLRLLQSSIPWIICLRAKFKTRQTKNNSGKTEVVKDDNTTPIQADDFIFEMTVHGEIMPNHSFRLTKCSHPELRRCMPNNEPVTADHGKLLAEWCASAGKSQKAVDPVKAAKAELWELLKPIRGSEKSWDSAEGWLIAKALIVDGETLTGNSLSADRVREILDGAKEALEEGLPV